MMCPDFASSIAGSSRNVSLVGPEVSSAPWCARSHGNRSTESNAVRRIERPALLTRMSTDPNRSAIVSASSSTASPRERSAGTMCAHPSPAVNLVPYVFEVFLTARNQDHLGSPTSQKMSCRLTDPRRGSRQDDGLVGKRDAARRNKGAQTRRRSQCKIAENRSDHVGLGSIFACDSVRTRP